MKTQLLKIDTGNILYFHFCFALRRVLASILYINKGVLSIKELNSNSKSLLLSGTHSIQQDKVHKIYRNCIVNDECYHF